MSFSLTGPEDRVQRLRGKITNKKQIEQKAIVSINNLAVVLFIFKENIFPVSIPGPSKEFLLLLFLLLFKTLFGLLKFFHMKKCFICCNTNLKKNKSWGQVKQRKIFFLSGKQKEKTPK
jgi:hypothetical protein